MARGRSRILRDDGLRVCARCGTAKPIEEFYDPPGSYCRVCSRRAVLDWRARHPRRRHAHQRVANALKYGELTRPDACETCGERRYVMAHHENYERPLDVVWLCDSCHTKRHIELGRSRPRQPDRVMAWALLKSGAYVSVEYVLRKVAGRWEASFQGVPFESSATLLDAARIAADHACNRLTSLEGTAQRTPAPSPPEPCS